MRRLFPAIALLATLALIFGACAPAATPAPTAAPAAAPTAPSAAPAAAPPTPAPAAAAPPTAPPAPAKVDKITFPMASASGLYWPMFIGRKEGFYQKQNIELDTILVNGAPGQLQALVANAAQISGVQVQATIAAVEKGTISAHILGNLARSVPYVLVAQKDIKTIAGLKGKRYGVSALTAGEVSLSKKVLATAGLKLDDVELIVSGQPAARVAALKGGTLGATVVLVPDDAALAAEGYSVLAKVADVVGDFPFLSYTVTDDFAKAHGDLLVRFFKATNLATQWLFDPANKDEAIKVLIEETKMDAQAAKASYDSYVTGGILSKDMLIGEKGTNAVLDLMIDVGDLKPPAPDYKKYLDLSYLEKATKQ